MIIKQLCADNRVEFASLPSPVVTLTDKLLNLPLLRMNLSDDRYVFYTEVSTNKGGEVQADLHTIITVHGIPGSPNDFIELQKYTQ